MSKDLNELTLEELFEKASSCATALDSNELSLEDAISNYEMGMKIIAALNDKLNEAEKKIKVIRGDKIDE